MPLKDSKPDDQSTAADDRIEPLVLEISAVPEAPIPPTIKEIIVTATPESVKKIAIAEHQVLHQPDVTKVVFWADKDLITAMVPNPCGLKPGTLYTMAEIDAVVSPEMIQSDAA
jgi:hypothetical protein